MPQYQKALTVSINIAKPDKPVAWVSVLRFVTPKVKSDATATMLTPECHTYSEPRAQVDYLKRDLDGILRSAKSQLPP